MSSAPPQPVNAPPRGPYPFYLGGLAATIAASITHPLDLTKVRLQASGDTRMLASIQKTYRTAGARGLFDGITGTWLRQMSYSVCRFWAYDECKRWLGATKDSGPGTLVLAGAMAGGIAGAVGNPGEIVMVRLQGDAAKPPEKQFSTSTRSMRSSGCGTVATTVCSPADVVKSRIMNASGPGSTSSIAAIRTALATEGPLFMFKGWLPAWTRLQPTTVLIFVCFEQLKAGWDWWRN
uniref:Mitochondrial carrier n=1 Tax=Schizophyllum commune (strain H4-8 / FGSC 9210) TaxID=578458 RepID=D8PMU1_SCHCM